MAPSPLSRQLQPTPSPVYCICREPDDAERPMIACDGGCEDWFHWDCVGLDEIGYEDVEDYICPNCEVKTGNTTTRRPLLNPPAYPIIYPSIEQGDEDAYSDNSQSNSINQHSRTSKKPRLRKKGRLASVSGSDEEEVTKPKPKSRSKASTKRSSTTTSAASKSKPPPPSPLSPSTTADDPIRRACIKGIVEVLRTLLNGDEVKAKAYGTELEGRVWIVEGADEGDAGRKKYLDRMRSLRFNVSKVDRKELRQGIFDGIIVPEMLSKMSSNELANPLLQRTYQFAAEDNFRTRLLPSDASSSSAPMVVHNHKGVVEVESSRRDDLEREEDDARREGEEERRKKRARKEDEVDKSKGKQSSEGKKMKMMTKELDLASAAPLGSTRNQSSSAVTLTSALPPTSVDTKQGNNLSALGSTSPAVSNTSLAPTLLSAYPNAPFSLDDLLPDEAPPPPPSRPSHNGPPHNQYDPGSNVSSFFSDGLPPSSHLSAEAAGGPQDDDDRGRQDGPMMMDFWMDDDEVEIVEQPSKKSEVVAGVRKTSVESEEEIGRRKMKELLARDPIWTGSITNPDAPGTGTLVFVPLFYPSSSSTSSHRPLSDFPTTSLLPYPPPTNLSIAGRVPIEPSRKFLHQAQLSSSKEVIVVLIEGSEDQEGVRALDGLRTFLTGRSRDALVHPHTVKGPLPLGAARELYIVAVKQSDPLPEFLEALNEDDALHPLPSAGPGRGKDLLFGVFVRNRVASGPSVGKEEKSRGKGKSKGKERETAMGGSSSTGKDAEGLAAPISTTASSHIASLLANLSSLIPALPNAPSTTSSAPESSTMLPLPAPTASYPGPISQSISTIPSYPIPSSATSPSDPSIPSTSQAYLQSRLQHTQQAAPHSLSLATPFPQPSYGSLPVSQQQCPPQQQPSYPPYRPFQPQPTHSVSPYPSYPHPSPQPSYQQPEPYISNHNGSRSPYNFQPGPSSLQPPYSSVPSYDSSLPPHRYHQQHSYLGNGQQSPSYGEGGSSYAAGRGDWDGGRGGYGRGSVGDGSMQYGHGRDRAGSDSGPGRGGRGGFAPEASVDQGWSGRGGRGR